MSISITQDIKTITDLKKNTHLVFEQVHDTGRPIFITVHGKPDVVILDAKVYEEQLKTIALGHLLSKAEKDVKQKRTRSARTFLKELKDNAKKISG